MRFQAPQLGAMGVTFSIMRVFQFVSLIAMIGLCANFISGIAAAEHDAPAELIGTLTVVRLPRTEPLRRNKADQTRLSPQ